MPEFHDNVLISICEIDNLFLFPRPQVLGKGIPNITAGEETGTSTRRNTKGNLKEEKATSSSPSDMNGANNSVLSEAAAAEPGGHGSNSPTAALWGEHSRHGPDTSAGQEDGKNAESGVDKRIHLLDCARWQMAHAGAIAAAACIEATAALEAHGGRPTSAER